MKCLKRKITGKSCWVNLRGTWTARPKLSSTLAGFLCKKSKNKRHMCSLSSFTCYLITCCPHLPSRDGHFLTFIVGCILGCSRHLGSSLHSLSRVTLTFLSFPSPSSVFPNKACFYFKKKSIIWHHFSPFRRKRQFFSFRGWRTWF